MSDDFCLIHGYEHMKAQLGNPIPYCEACENEREDRITDEMVDKALNAWFASPPSETDQGLERSMRAALEAAFQIAHTENCPTCGRTVLAKNIAATGFLALCGRRLVDPSELGGEAQARCQAYSRS